MENYEKGYKEWLVTYQRVKSLLKQENITIRLKIEIPHRSSQYCINLPKIWI